MFFKKVMELTDNDIQEILMNVSLKKLTDEIFSRDAKLVIHQLNEKYQLELLQQLLKDRPLSPEMEEELLHQASRSEEVYAIQTERDIELVLTKILKKQTIIQILETIVKIIKGHY